MLNHYASNMRHCVFVSADGAKVDMAVGFHRLKQLFIGILSFYTNNGQRKIKSQIKADNVTLVRERLSRAVIHHSVTKPFSCLPACW